MNRILQWIEDEPSAILPAPPDFANSLLVSEEKEEVAQTIVTPLHYERNYAYPLIVWLHDANDDERQVTRVMPLVSSRNYAAVGPRGTMPQPRAGYRWAHSASHIDLAERRVAQAIEQAQRWLNIAPARVFLAGLGCGGEMALRLALLRPQAFAGVLSIGGRFPRTLRPLAQLQAARKLRIFMASSRDSSDYPQADVCADLRLFHAAGMSVCLRQYPCGDELTENMLADMNRWIMEQINEPQAAAQDQASAERRQ